LDLPRILILALTLTSMAISGPTIRFVVAPALAVAFWRVALAWPVLAGVALARRERWPLLRGAAAGLFLAWHWIGWVLAVQTTAMASASVLISTGVLWASLLSRPVLGEPLSRRQWLGLALALLGVTVVVSAGHGGRHTLRGDLYALSGAVAWVAYSFIGRRARQRAGFWSYTASVYGTVGLLLLGATLIRGVPLAGYEPRSWLALGVLALFPTLLGHGGFNYLLRFLGPARLGLFTLSEPVCATLLAWPLFGEPLGLQVGLGGLAVLAGVALGIGERAPATGTTPARVSGEGSLAAAVASRDEGEAS